MTTAVGADLQALRSAEKPIEEKKHPWPHDWRDPPKKEVGAVWCTNCRCFVTRAAGVFYTVCAPRYGRPSHQNACKHTTTRPVTQRWCTMCGYLESRAAEGPDAQPAGDGDCTGAKAASGLGERSADGSGQERAHLAVEMAADASRVDIEVEALAKELADAFYDGPRVSWERVGRFVLRQRKEREAALHETITRLEKELQEAWRATRKAPVGRASVEHCSKCGRSRPTYIADPTCNASGYCDWVGGPDAPRSTAPAAPEAKEVAMPLWLTCPCCGCLHIDEGEFATKLHHTHACQYCGLTWRPAIGPTVGVAFLPGFKNKP